MAGEASEYETRRRERAGWADKVAEVVKGDKDHIGDTIVEVFSSNSPYYAIYRTPTRLVVQYADDSQMEGDKRLADVQRTRLSPLAPLRGQINGLIDGWHSTALRKPDDNPANAPEQGTLDGVIDYFRQFLPSRQREARRAFYYDRRVADALIVLLDDTGALDTTQTLLTQVKNDIITERTTIARGAYLRWALVLAVGLIALCSLLAAGTFDKIHKFPDEVRWAWSAVAGGGVGAFFSLALGLKQRNLTIDLQSRENLVDVVVRMLIGAIGGGIFYTLVRTGVVQTNVFKLDLSRDTGLFDLTVFLMGFVAGFLERLVPNLLNTTNFAKTEPTTATGTPISPTAGPPAAPTPSPSPSPSPSPAATSTTTTGGGDGGNLAADDPDASAEDAGQTADDPDGPAEGEEAGTDESGALAPSSTPVDNPDAADAVESDPAEGGQSEPVRRTGE